jgi:hypothetical protein
MKKKILKNRADKQLFELMSALLELQKETDYCVFFDYSGHVNSIDLRISKNKRKYNECLLTAKYLRI